MSKLKSSVLIVALVTLVGTPAMAQDKKGEIGIMFGWTFADGIDGTQAVAADGNVYDRVDPKDSFKWGISGGGYVGPNGEVGFMFSQAMTKLELGGTNTRELGDMTVNNYHGYFAYNSGDPDAALRGYFFGGVGATQFGEVDYRRVIDGAPGTIGSSTRFSTTWGLGVKMFSQGGSVGARVGIQWTPTYIQSEAGGWWCDPYWGCYLAGSAKYANQWDLNGGLAFRF